MDISLRDSCVNEMDDEIQEECVVIPLLVNGWGKFWMEKCPKRSLIFRNQRGSGRTGHATGRTCAPLET